MKILVTGCAGFIGYHLCLKLLEKNKHKVYGLDNISNYYDVKLKNSRLKNLKEHPNKFYFHKIDIENFNKLKNNFKNNNYDYVIHLAAQAGVRASIQKPSQYVRNNLIGFFNVLEISKIFKIKHLGFASTSSVYGSTKKFPLSEDNNTDKPLSFYAATKKSNELMAYSYSNIHKLPCTGLRLFTVYGPYGRPDMSLFKFTKAIFNSNKIDLFNRGNHVRDFTYIDDTVNAISKIIFLPSKKKIPFSVFNVASSNPKNLKLFLNIIEKVIGKKSLINYLKMQPGDVYKTHGSIKRLSKKINYKPKIKISKGIERFIKWYKKYYKIN